MARSKSPYTIQNKRRLVAAIQDEFTTAEGACSDAMQASREEALQYYEGQLRGDEVDGKSSVISMDLAASVNATLALMRSMLIDDLGAAFIPQGPEDEAQAKAESDIVSDVIFNENDGTRKLMAVVKDALLSRQAVIAVDVENYGDDENMHHEIELRSVPSEYVSYQSAYDGPLQDVRFFAEQVLYTRSDLVAMGCDKDLVWKLSDANILPWNQAAGRRNKGGQKGNPSSTRATDEIGCFWVFIQYDLDGDGIAERHRILYADNEIVKAEPFAIIPYAMGSPFLTPHRLSGESLHDRAKQSQDIGTALTRQLIDNITVGNNFRFKYNPSRCTEEDILNPTAGGGIRCTDINSVEQLLTQDLSQGILAGLEFNKRKRAESVGSATDMASAEAQLMHKTATQASIEKSNSELISSLIADNFAQTLIKDLFVLVRTYLRTYATRAYVANVRGQAVEVDPLTWAPRRHIRVRAGKTPGEKAQEAQALAGHVQLSSQAMQLGLDGQLADATTLYRSQMEYLRLMGVDEPESYAIDPTSPAAKQAREAAEQNAQAQAQKMEALQKRIAELETAKIAEDARQADQEIRFKYDELAVEQETELTKLSAEGQLKLEQQARDHRNGAARAAQTDANTQEAR